MPALHRYQASKWHIHSTTKFQATSYFFSRLKKFSTWSGMLLKLNVILCSWQNSINSVRSLVYLLCLEQISFCHAFKITFNFSGIHDHVEIFLSLLKKWNVAWNFVVECIFHFDALCQWRAGISVRPPNMNQIC